MVTAQNPFEEDEIEPVGNGRVKPPASAGGHVGTGTGGSATGAVPSRHKVTRTGTG